MVMSNSDVACSSLTLEHVDTKMKIADKMDLRIENAIVDQRFRCGHLSLS